MQEEKIQMRLRRLIYLMDHAEEKRATLPHFSREGAHASLKQESTNLTLARADKKAQHPIHGGVTVARKASFVFTQEREREYPSRGIKASSTEEDQNDVTEVVKSVTAAGSACGESSSVAELGTPRKARCADRCRPKHLEETVPASEASWKWSANTF